MKDSDFGKLCRSFDKLKGGSIVYAEQGWAVLHNDLTGTRGLARTGLDPDLTFMVDVSDLIRLFRFMDQKPNGSKLCRNSGQLLARRGKSFVSCAVQSGGIDFPERTVSDGFEISDPISVNALCKVFAGLAQNLETVDSLHGNIAIGQGSLVCLSSSLMAHFKGFECDRDVVVKDSISAFQPLLENGFRAYVDERGLYVEIPEGQIFFTGRAGAGNPVQNVVDQIDRFDGVTMRLSLDTWQYGLTTSKGRKVIDLMTHEGVIYIQAPDLRLELTGEIIEDDKHISVALTRLSSSIKAISQLYGLDKDSMIDVTIGEMPQGLLLRYEDMSLVIARSPNS